MSDYSLAKIYQLRCNVTGDCYIGSTVQTLSQRMWEHVSDFKRWQNNNHKHKCSSSQIIERGDYEITLMQAFPCNNKSELHWRERYYQENTRQCINKNSAIITPEEAKERKLQSIKKWNAANKDKISTRGKVYYQANKEAIRAYQTERNKKNE